MISSFVHSGQPGRVVFGAGTVKSVADELAALGIGRAGIVTTPGQARLGTRIAEYAGQRGAGTLPLAVMHVPVEVAAEAVARVTQMDADGLVAVGGGSAIGLAKAIAQTTGLPILAIPTTYSGSEMTPVVGTTDAGEKRTVKDEKVRPRTVIYDPDLTLDLPLAVSMTSGLNGMAHAVEALYAREANPLTSLMAEEAIRALARGLPAVHAAPRDAAARATTLYGAWLSGFVLAHVGMALHHKLCHVLGGSFNLPHAETHSVILAHTVAYTRPAAEGALRRADMALGGDAATFLFELTGRLGAPRALRDIGMREVDLDRAADLAVAAPYWNPRPVERAGIRRLLDNAYFGRSPAA